MNNKYNMIFKRKSFHIFLNNEGITEEELRRIEKCYLELIPLDPSIKTSMKIVPGEQAACKRRQEYCLYLYSEKKKNYLQNIGYIGEQLDLLLTEMNIGTLWFGIGKPEEIYNGDLEYVIMIAIGKQKETAFRKNMYKSKRKELKEMWEGNEFNEIGDIVRFAPSACNTQPWYVKASSNELLIYRYKMPGKRGIMPINKVIYYNRIDIGIFLLFLETCLKQNEYSFQRILFDDELENETELTLFARYLINKKCITNIFWELL